MYKTIKNAVTIHLDAGNLGVETTADEIYGAVKTMFSLRNAKDIPIPQGNPTDTILSRVDQDQMKRAIFSLQERGEVSHVDGRTFKRMINLAAFNVESKRIVDAVTDITNLFTSKRQKDESTNPMGAVRVISI